MGLGSSVRLVIFQLSDCVTATAASVGFPRVAFRFGERQELKVFSHSDNIGVLVPQHLDTAVLEKNLSDAFTAHPAGPFTLTTSGARMLSRPFRFLGYDFVKPLGRPARASAPDAEAREAVYYADMQDAKSMADLTKVRASSWAIAQPSGFQRKFAR